VVLENRDGLRGAVWCRGAKLNFAENLLTRADDTPVVMMDMPPLLDFMALKSSRNLGNRMTVIHISKGRTKHMLVGALLASGHTQVEVKSRPRVGIIPTGDELIAPGEEPLPGAVIEFNSTILAAFLREWGAAPIKYPRAKDQAGLLEEAVRRAVAECDLVTIIAAADKFVLKVKDQPGARFRVRRM